jgi:transposase
MINGHPTAEDAARELDISVKTLNSWVKRWVARGLIPKPPTFRYGLRRVRYFPSSYVKELQTLRDTHGSRE